MVRLAVRCVAVQRETGTGRREGPREEREEDGVGKERKSVDTIERERESDEGGGGGSG